MRALQPVFLAVTILAVTMLTTSTAAWGQQTVSASIGADADVQVEVTCISGTLRFVAGGDSEVVITGTVGDDADFQIEGEGGEVEIEIDIPDRGRRKGHLRIDADLEIRVPRGARLEIETISASVEVSDLSGGIEVETISGNVTVVGELSGVEVESVSGSISVSGSSGRTEAETVSGKVVLEDITGDVQAMAVNGSIEIRGAQIGSGELEAVNGSILFDGDLDPGGRLEVESYVGNVELILGSTSAYFEIETLSGQIVNELTSDRPRSERFGPSKRLEFTAGGGDARVEVETVSGNVTIRP